ncbi:unnamed protein product [Polarella glacialis]|uniref:Pseudouridine synthase RsuA/RluA-like domain-containing protein n=1 Tax=Polarella glacialis TaxID=89957 RepID=A0A813G6P9_POLGL|nr:unnamed protein product [Polarella glacialis]
MCRSKPARLAVVPTEARQTLQRLVLGAKSAADLLALLGGVAVAGIGSILAVSCFWRLGRLSATLTQRLAAGSIFQALLDLLLDLAAHGLDPRSLSSTMAAAAHLRGEVDARLAQVCQGCADALTSQRCEATPHELANAVWAMAKLIQRNQETNSEFCSILLGAARPQLSKFSPQGLSNVSWAFASLELRDTEFIHDLAREEVLARQPGEFKAQEVSWAFAKLGLTSSSSSFEGLISPLLAGFLYSATQKMRVGDGEPVGGRYLSNFLEVAATKSAACLPEFKMQELCNVAWAFATLGGTVDLLRRTGRALDGPQGLCSQTSLAAAELAVFPAAAAGPSEQPTVVLQLADRLVLQKPPGWELPSQKAKGEILPPGEQGSEGCSLASYLQAYFGRRLRPILKDDSHGFGFVHRLDKPGSGLVVAATTYEAYYDLLLQLNAGELLRDYVVLLRGFLPRERSEVRARVSWLKGSRQSSEVKKTGRPSATQLKVLAYAQRDSCAFSLVAVRIVTGRRHQIRVHAAHVGHPTVSDGKYSSEESFREDQSLCEQNFLHRHHVAFQDAEGKVRSAFAPLPPDLRLALEQLTPRDALSAEVFCRFRLCGWPPPDFDSAAGAAGGGAGALGVGLIRAIVQAVLRVDDPLASAAPATPLPSPCLCPESETPIADLCASAGSFFRELGLIEQVFCLGVLVGTWVGPILDLLYILHRWWQRQTRRWLGIDAIASPLRALEVQRKGIHLLLPQLTGAARGAARPKAAASSSAESRGSAARDVGGRPETAGASSSNRGAVGLSEQQRLALALRLGLWVQRRLAGQRGGVSGRDENPADSTLYLVFRGHTGQIFDPVLVFRSWAAARALVAPTGAFGQSLFIGLPSEWEARQVVASAGCRTVEQLVTIIPVGRFDGKLLVAIPHVVWNRIWMGVLSSDAERYLFVPFDVDTLGFQFASTDPMEGVRFPLAEALNNAAAEHYTFMSAPSESGKEMGIATPPKEAGLKPTAKAAGVKRAEPAGKADAAAVPGLAPGLVRAARASGIDEATLEAMSALIKKAPPRLGEQPAARARSGPLSESEAEVEEDAADEDEPLAQKQSASKGVEKAISQLTKLVTMLASEKDSAKTVSKLDRALEGLSQAGSGSTESGAPSGAARRSAAALRALRFALTDEPEQIYRPIEKAMGEQIRAQSDLPGVLLAADSRVWLEHRSHVQAYPTTIRWMWAIAGIHSCLKSERYEEARARTALLLAAGEQFSMDGGSWLLAAEILLEQPPPFSSFACHQLPEPTELQHSRLVDPRWIDAIMAKLKEAEDFQERRKRLQRLPTGGGQKGEGREKELEKEKQAAAWKAKTVAAAKAKAAAKVKVPGGAAQSYLARRLWLRQLRDLLKIRGSLPEFTRSVLSSTRTNHTTPSKQEGTIAVWPMPSLYLECWKRSEERIAGRAFKIVIILLVVVFSWLLFRRPRFAPPAARIGAPLSSGQQQAVGRLESLAAAWNVSHVVEPSDMGRSALEVEGLEAVLQTLLLKASSLRTDLAKYSPSVRRGSSADALPDFDSRDQATVEIGHVSRGSLQLAKEIYLEPDRDLYFSGDGLKDYYYYYCFRVSLQRALRDRLSGSWGPTDLQHPQCCKREFWSQPALCVALATMALGDLNATEEGQAAHVALAARAAVMSPSEILTMSGRGPRRAAADLIAGVIMDDFVALSPQIKSELLDSDAFVEQTLSTLGGAEGDGVSGLGGFLPTAVNPANNPTRDRPVREPTHRLPACWGAAAQGPCEFLDASLVRSGLDPDVPSGAPLLEMACEKVQIEGLKPRLAKSAAFLKGEHWRPAGADFGFGAVRSRRGPALPHYPSGNPADAGGCAPSGGAASLDDYSEGRRSAHPKQSVCPLVLSPAAIALLATLPESRFLRPGRRDPHWRPTMPGFFDFYSGPRGAAKALRMKGAPWVLTFDFLVGPDQDLLDRETRVFLEACVDAGAFSWIGAAPNCASFSTAVTPPVRTPTYPRGVPWMTSSMKVKVRDGNSHSHWLCSLLLRAHRLGIPFWVTNLDGSGLWRQRAWQRLAKRLGAGLFRFEFCRMGPRWRKRTRKLTTTELRDNTRLCGQDETTRCCQHLVLRGRCAARNLPWTKGAEPYPAGLCQVRAVALLNAAGLQPERKRLDIVSCARACCSRIGEAPHPGPGRKVQAQIATRFLDRKGVELAGVALVEPNTEQLRQRAWDRFETWIRSAMTNKQMKVILSVPELAVTLLVQHPKIVGVDVVAFAVAVFAALPRHEKLYPGSASHYRRRWDAILKAIERRPCQTDPAYFWPYWEFAPRSLEQNYGEWSSPKRIRPEIT